MFDTAPVLRNPLILVIDDNEDDLRLTERSIRRHMPEASLGVCLDGERAVDTLLGYARGPEALRPALVLMDQKMPLLNGSEVMDRLRLEEGLLQVPVVLFSSSALPVDVANCFHTGIRSYVRKPIDPSEYDRAVRGIVDYWIHLNLHAAWSPRQRLLESLKA